MDLTIEIVFNKEDIEVLLLKSNFVESTAYIPRDKLLKSLFREVK